MNIFLVEDEPPILRDIIAVIESFHEDYDIIGSALDGQAALDFLNLRGAEVDVMITDIHVPVIDGMELISMISESHPHILCIILTGYSLFEYARRALQYGVFDYLLKPVDENELRSQLKKAYAKKCLDSLQQSELPGSNRNVPNHIPNQITDSVSAYHLAVICLGTFPLYSVSPTSLNSEIWRELHLNTHLKQHLPQGWDYWIMNGNSSSEKNILFSAKSSSAEENRAYIREILSPLLSFPYTITIAVDTSFHRIHMFRQSLNTLRAFLSKNVRLEHSRLLFYPDNEAGSGNATTASIESCSKRLENLFRSQNIALFKTELKQYVLRMKKEGLTQQALFDSLYDLLNACITSSEIKLSNLGNSNLHDTVLDIVMLSDSYRSLYENLVSIFDDFFETMLRDVSFPDSKQDILRKIDSYIKNYYTTQISIGQLADHFGFTPAYLSKIFREYKNIPPFDYILQLRMEKAKELFNASVPCKIKEVAIYVGYEDSLYFSKVFKKYTGLSPKQFMDKIKTSKD